jgi:hypothetical protein
VENWATAKLRVIVLVFVLPTVVIIYCSVKNFLDFGHKQMVAFLDTLKDATRENGVLKLAACNFEFFRIFVSGLFVRTHYDALYNMIIQTLPKIDVHLDFVLVGTPGIGKTYFAYFLLWMLIQTKQTFVFEPWRKKDGLRQAWIYHGEQEIKLFDQASGASNAPQRGTISRVNSEYLAVKFQVNRKVLHIIDGHKPDESPFQRVLICSPQPEYYQEMRSKLATTMRFMPVWSKQEILECRSLLYSELDEALVEHMMSRWGGVPRYVFQQLSAKLSKWLQH